MWKRVKRQSEEKIEGYRAEKLKCEKRREEIKEENRRNYEKYREGEMGREEFLRAREKLEERKECLKRREMELNELIDRKKETMTRENVSKEELKEYADCKKLTREVLEKYVEGIYVYDDGRVEMKIVNKGIFIV